MVDPSAECLAADLDVLTAESMVVGRVVGSADLTVEMRVVEKVRSSAACWAERTAGPSAELTVG